MIKLTPGKPPYYETTTNPKFYRVLLSQAGTAEPEANVLGTNNIGTINWIRVEEGLYQGQIQGEEGLPVPEFPLNKTWLNIVNNSGGPTTIMTLARLNANTVQVLTEIDNALTDGLLTNTPIEIITF